MTFKRQPPELSPLTAAVTAIICQQGRQAPPETGLVEISGWSGAVDFAECPWCGENHDEADGLCTCTHCGKAFEVAKDEEGSYFARPMMTRRDQDYLDWLEQKRRETA